ncbi:response regulator transcription factor [Hymenobacter aquaticus]|uniref:Response regulator transcription factor n=1 Tax=Hymenobacter aquaticus TaxID=1867101 RepID=A0A4Z0PUH3_9BACT|nr:LuxR C-terminal-related transcriptional regulator [Hymenobacter aquaticus]TGE20543.1 response regulator transcription factor [Hymenobacter aquaticus]
MSSTCGTILIAAPATLHRQGLLATVREACPDLSICLVPDAALLLALLRRHAYALLILDAALTPGPVWYLLEQLYLTRWRQPVLCFTDAATPVDVPVLTPTAPRALLARYASPAEVGRTLRLLTSPGPGSGRLVARRRPGPATPFSRRELEVLRLVVADHCNQEIADQLCLSVRTVESHRRALLQKAGARTLLGLAVQAVREGWVLS